MSSRIPPFDELSSMYQDLVRTIIPGPQSLSYFVPLTSLLTALLIPSTVLSRNTVASIFLPIITASTIHAWLAMSSSDVISMDTLWWSLFFLLFRDPKSDFRRLVPAPASSTERQSRNRSSEKRSVKASTEPKHDALGATSPSPEPLFEEAYPSSFLSRTRWILVLFSNRPLTSWKMGDPSHDARVQPPYIRRSRRAFISSILTILLPTLFLGMPLALQLHAHDHAYTHPSSLSTDPTPTTITILQRLLPTLILRPLTLGLYVYSLMALLFLPPYLLPVLATFLLPTSSGSRVRWSPHTWPAPHFGPFSAVLDSGLRGLWGRWWHQQMRHAVSEPGRWLAQQLGAKGRVRYALISASAFLLSGLTHAGLVPPEPRWAAPGISAWRLRGMVALFFWVQPAGIMMEIAVVEPAIVWLLGGKEARAGWMGKVIERALRMVWVLGFMAFALQFLVLPFKELRFWSIWPPVVFSEGTRSVLRGDWLP